LAAQPADPNATVKDLPADCSDGRGYPKTWAKPWGGEYEFTLSPGLYEYACHEGNYGLPDILAGARAEEAQAKLKKANSGG
jgi:hypothetical protein